MSGAESAPRRIASTACRSPTSHAIDAYATQVGGARRDVVGYRKVRRAAQRGDHGSARTCTCASGIYEGQGDAQVVVFQRKVKFLFDFSCSELDWVAEDDGGSALFKGKGDCGTARPGVADDLGCPRRLRRRLSSRDGGRSSKRRVPPWRRWRQNSRLNFVP